MSDILAKDAKKLQQALEDNYVPKQIKREAWSVLKKRGIEGALQFVENSSLPSPTQDPVPYKIWGRDAIDKASIAQMRSAATLAISRKGALMPDAHLGYGLPIGGVLATEDAIIPYAVGVDIACRMRITIFAVDEQVLESHNDLLKASLVNQTRFGVGAQFENDDLSQHAVLDDEGWTAFALLRGLKSKAVQQLGSSGGGNHFVEWGTFKIDKPNPALGITQAGTYLALLSHSGSRGVGYKIANHYSKLAMRLHPHMPKDVKHLAWLDMDSEVGQEYWIAMNLAGKFAAANHEVIHQRLADATGFDVLGSAENHHNFAWKEQVDGKELIVHRKGATPAGKGVLGIIPGSMGDPGFVVQGKGNPDSINSASHGAGRKMSRTAAKKAFSREEQLAYLKPHNIELIGGGLDETPHAYKSIYDVMEAQADLVDIVGEFMPSIVRMADD